MTPPEDTPTDPRIEHYRDLLRSQVEGRRMILCMGVVAGMTGAVRTLSEMGAGPFLLLGFMTGAGGLPDPDIAEWYLVDEPPAGLTTSEELHHYGRSLSRLPPDIVAAIDRFDPDRTALVLPGFPIDFEEVAGRPNFAPRKPEWIALEDKVGLDALWDDLGVPRAPSEEWPVDAAALKAAHARLDRGDGTVWAADARDGFTGGASGLRWITRAEQMAEAIEFFAARADTVRVMPFLEGIPCSIHGIVFSDDIVALRPCEMVVLRRPGQSLFKYAGSGTHFDPPPADREAMRSLVKHVGAELRTRFAYRGTFTIDGIMTSDGFRPTELNPRFGAAIGIMTHALPGLPLVLLDLWMRAGVELDWRPKVLEAMIIDAADRNRTGGGWGISPGHRDDSTTRNIVWTGETYRLAEECEEHDGTLMCGPALGGTFSRFLTRPGRAPIGPSIAPRVIEALKLCDAALGSAFGELTAAKPMR